MATRKRRESTAEQKERAISMRLPWVLPVLILVLALSACVGRGDPNKLTWTPKQPHEALQAGATVSGSYYPMICPCVPDYYVARRDGSFVKTFAELQTLLRPIDTPERALAYRKLLGDIQLERDDLLTALEWTSPLDFDDGERPFFGVYVQADATRWGVGTEPVIEQTAAAIVITQPSYRMIETVDENGKAWVLGEGRVELVRETIHRDGRYEREVVRVLEEGESARVHQPAPLL